MDKATAYISYLNTLRQPFIKLCRLRFLNPDGTTAFAIDNNPLNKRSGAFVQDGTITCNLQNGQRRQADVTLSNIDGKYDYNISALWFGQEIAIDEGMILPDGTEYYIPQGVFLIETPTEIFNPNERIVQLSLVDKWANLDGTLFGNLDGTYQVPVNTNIFEAIQSVLNLYRSNPTYTWAKCKLNKTWDITKTLIGTAAPSGFGEMYSNYAITDDGYFSISASSSLTGYSWINNQTKNQKSIYYRSIKSIYPSFTYNYYKWTLADDPSGVEKGDLLGYVSSDDTSAYPDNGQQDGYWYVRTDSVSGTPVDGITPIFTEYYNGKTQELPDGSIANLTDTPYTLKIDSDSGTYADVVLGLSDMLNAWIGYDSTGALRVDPSQDDILDTNKPILWQFSPDEVTFLGATYTVKNTEVYNDVIVMGEALSDYAQAAGRATNLDLSSDTNIYTSLGKRTVRISSSGYYTKQQCEDLAVWKLKRMSVLQKSVEISCGQLFHIEENDLVTIQRTDKPGAPIERHLIMGFSRPLSQTGEMTISAVSVNDFANATVTSWPE